MIAPKVIEFSLRGKGVQALEIFIKRLAGLDQRLLRIVTEIMCYL